MKKDKLSWARLVSEAEAKQLPLIDYLLERSAAQVETDKDAVLKKTESMLQVMEEAVAYGMTGVKSNSGLTGGSAKKLKEYITAAADKRSMFLRTGQQRRQTCSCRSHRHPADAGGGPGNTHCQ